MVAFGAKSIILEVYIKNPHFMLNRKEYDLIQDSLAYYEFRMTSEQRKSVDAILDKLFTGEDNA